MIARRLAHRVDWFRVVSDLQRAGLSLRDLARELERAVVTIHGWTSHSQPKHDDGEALIALWSERTGNVRDSVPTVRHPRRRMQAHTAERNP